MKVFPKTFRFNRNVSFFIFFVLLMVIFFASFYFYYIPSNKESLNKYAFLILNNIKEGIDDRSYDLKEVLTTNIKDSIEKKSATNSVNKSHIIKGLLVNVTTKNFDYSFTIDSSAKQYSYSKEHNLLPLFSTYKDELFDGFMLMKNNDSILSNIKNNLRIDPGNHIRTDSLLKDLKGLFIPGTRVITIGDIEYNMFYVPFTLDNQNMMLLGFLQTSTYNTKLHEIPPSLIYVFVTLFLMLIAALPVLKFFFMSREEEIKFSDLFLFVFSLLTGSTLITLCIIQFMILRSNEIRAINNLESLSEQIKTSFLQELSGAYKKLNTIDAQVCRDPQPITNTNDSNAKRVSINFDRTDTKQFEDYDRVFWLNDSGMQVMKGEKGKATPFLYLGDRDYFKVFQYNDLYQVPDLDDSLFTFSPIHNRINGWFKTVIAKRSCYPGAYMVGLLCDFRSVTQTILPAGYKFCIINEAGQVQYHSDSARNLNENFLTNLDNPESIEKAIRSRQSASLNEQGLYGKSYCVNITPIKNLPFYVATFYDKSQVISLNMRILIFALLMCFISFLLYMGVWYSKMWKPVQGLNLLQDPVKSSNWIIPKPAVVSIYRSFIIFLSCYSGIIIMLAIRLKTQEISNNYAMLLIMIATPFNLIASALVILNKHRSISHGVSVSSTKKIRRMLAVSLAVFLSVSVLLLVFASRFAYFIYFETLLFILLNFYYYYVIPPDGKSETENIHRFSKYYSFTSILTIVLLAILPACIFTWYSHNQEIVQTVKKQQLYLASKIEQRKSTLQKILFDSIKVSDDYYYQMCYEKGIYTIYSDVIKIAYELPGEIANSSFDDFYFSISNTISNEFDKNEFYPALQDISTDSLWRWYVYPTGSLSFYYHVNHQYSQTYKTSANSYIEINSHQPPRFVFVNWNERGFYLLILTAAILVGIYFIIYGMSEKVFLKKFVFIYKNKPEDYVPALVNKFISSTYGANSKRNEMMALFGKYRTKFNLHELTSISAAEQQLIEETEEHKSFFLHVWKDCTEKEKHLLYNFSKDGMLNFKNPTAIHALFKKGLLIVNKHYEACLFAASFRLYVLHYLPDDEMIKLKEQMKQHNTWESIKIPVLIILVAIACFIFFTQEQTWQKIIAFVTVFGSSFPLLMNLFTRSSGAKS